MCLVFFVSCRVVSSHQMKGKQDNGAGFASPFYLIRVRAWALFISPQSRLRLVRRLGHLVSSSVSPRLVPSRVISSDEGASKTTGRQGRLGLGFGFAVLPHHPCVGGACHPRFP